MKIIEQGGVGVSLVVWFWECWFKEPQVWVSKKELGDRHCQVEEKWLFLVFGFRDEFKWFGDGVFMSQYNTQLIINMKTLIMLYLHKRTFKIQFCRNPMNLQMHTLKRENFQISPSFGHITFLRRHSLYILGST